MHTGNSKQRIFDRTTRLMHWLTAGLMLLVLVLAFSIDRASSRASHMLLLQLHRSVGITIWCLTLARLVWRHFAEYPDWPGDMPPTMRAAGRRGETAHMRLSLR